MTTPIDLYVFVERNLFESDSRWLNTLSDLAGLDVPGFGMQVRTKSEPPERSKLLGREARAVTLDAPAPVLFNGTIDEALNLGYKGVHWPEALVPEHPAGRLLQKGASIHSPEAARKAEVAGADFLVAGTIFDAGSKPVLGEGVQKLKHIVAATKLPVLAIGGITRDRVAACIEAGAAGIAVVSSVLLAPDMHAAVQELREALDIALAAKGEV